MNGLPRPVYDPSSSVRLFQHTFKPEKPGFDIETARITGKTAVSTDDTVAWHYDANRVVVHRTADGCGENTMAFRAFNAHSDLKIVVEVGLVVGTIPAITPAGSAISQSFAAASLRTIPTVFMSLMYSYT